MMAASFAPMILKLVFPKLEKKMDELKLDIIEHIFKVGKIKESIEYREQPNEADLLGKQNQEHITMIAGEISGLEDRLKKLETLSKTPKKVK